MNEPDFEGLDPKPVDLGVGFTLAVMFVLMLGYLYWKVNP